MATRNRKRARAALTENMGKSNLSIYYAQSNNIKAAKKQIEWNFKGGCKCVEKDKKCFFLLEDRIIFALWCAKIKKCDR